MSGVSGGRPNTKGKGGGKGKAKGSKVMKSKMKVWCNVKGCTITPHAYDLKKHYKYLTEEEKLDKL